MLNFLPAVLVGGPSNAGKSVLFYRLTQALRERNVAHYALRACPDGEGNWFHEGDPMIVDTIKGDLKLTTWPPTFVERICQDLEHRCLPFLVDMGGRPSASQIELLRRCTHSILLLRADKPEETYAWENLVTECNLLPLARFFSEREGVSAIIASSPLLEGRLTGLDRHTPLVNTDTVFDELVERVATLLNSFDFHNRKRALLAQAPTELVLDLDEALRAFAATSKRWETAMLRPLLASLPAQTPLSVYGAGPGWLYAALAAYGDPQAFYLFDPKIPFGWIQPAHIRLGEEASSEICVKVQSGKEVTVLSITFPHDRLEYFQLEPLVFPHVSAQKGLIISGRLPNWLLTALVRFYKSIGVPWIAPFYVQEDRTVVVYSHSLVHQCGDYIAKPY